MRIKRHLMAAVLMLAAICANSKEPSQNDTIPIKNFNEAKIVEDESVNAKGQKTTKYYILHDGELIKTSRHVVETINLCKKHGARCHLAVVVNKKNNRKRIIVN